MPGSKNNQASHSFHLSEHPSRLMAAIGTLLVSLSLSACSQPKVTDPISADPPSLAAVVRETTKLGTVKYTTRNVRDGTLRAVSHGVFDFVLNRSRSTLVPTAGSVTKFENYFDSDFWYHKISTAQAADKDIEWTRTPVTDNRPRMGTIEGLFGVKVGSLAASTVHSKRINGRVCRSFELVPSVRTRHERFIRQVWIDHDLRLCRIAVRPAPGTKNKELQVGTTDFTNYGVAVKLRPPKRFRIVE